MRKIIIETVSKFRKKKKHGIKFDQMIRGPLEILRDLWTDDFSSATLPTYRSKTKRETKLEEKLKDKKGIIFSIKDSNN